MFYFVPFCASDYPQAGFSECLFVYLFPARDYYHVALAQDGCNDLLVWYLFLPMTIPRLVVKNI